MYLWTRLIPLNFGSHLSVNPDVKNLLRIFYHFTTVHISGKTKVENGLSSHRNTFFRNLIQVTKLDPFELKMERVTPSCHKNGAASLQLQRRYAHRGT